MKTILLLIPVLLCSALSGCDEELAKTASPDVTYRDDVQDSSEEVWRYECNFQVIRHEYREEAGPAIIVDFRHTPAVYEPFHYRIKVHPFGGACESTYFWMRVWVKYQGEYLLANYFEGFGELQPDGSCSSHIDMDMEDLLNFGFEEFRVAATSITSEGLSTVSIEAGEFPGGACNERPEPGPE